jgi:hypothetical protein
MAGLLDAFLNMTPEQNKGLMAAATKMLDMSAPSRVPRNIMQIAAHGMNAFDSGIQDERDRKIIEEQRAMQQQILGWKAKDAEADFGHQQGVRERDTRIAGRVRKLYEGGQDLNLGALEGVPGAAPDFTGNLSLPLLSLRTLGSGLAAQWVVPAKFKACSATSTADHQLLFQVVPTHMAKAEHHHQWAGRLRCRALHQVASRRRALKALNGSAWACHRNLRCR